MKLMRPGCVLLQALHGGTVDGFKLQCLGNWLVSMTPDMALYEITNEQLDLLIEHHMGKEFVDRL